MISDTITTIENQFFDGLAAAQEPTLEAVRKAAELVSQLPQLPLIDAAAPLVDKLPTAQEVVERNFAFAQRLLDAQRDFVVQLVAVSAEPVKAPAKKKAAA
jgi:hypothetical protein